MSTQENNRKWSTENGKLELLASEIASKLELENQLHNKHYVIDLDSTVGNGNSGICTVAQEATVKADGKKYYVITVHTPLAPDDKHLCAELGIALLLIAFSPSGKGIHINKQGIRRAESLALNVKLNDKRGASLAKTETFMSLFDGMTSGLLFTAVAQNKEDKKTEELPPLAEYSASVKKAVETCLDLVQTGIIERKELDALIRRAFKEEADATKAAKKAASQNKAVNAEKDKGLKAVAKPVII